MVWLLVNSYYTHRAHQVPSRSCWGGKVEAKGINFARHLGDHEQTDDVQSHEPWRWLAAHRMMTCGITGEQEVVFCKINNLKVLKLILFNSCGCRLLTK